MEENKSSVRSYKVNEHYKQSLKGGYEYYRVRLNAKHCADGSNASDAVFDIHKLLPMNRADLMSGEWHAFLERFTGLICRTHGTMCRRRTAILKWSKTRFHSKCL